MEHEGSCRELTSPPMINTFLLFEQQNLAHKNVWKVSYYSFDMSLSARNQSQHKFWNGFAGVDFVCTLGGPGAY